MISDLTGEPVPGAGRAAVTRTGTPLPPGSASEKDVAQPEGSVHIAGQLAEWPTKERMAAILRAAGLEVDVGAYSVRVKSGSHFVFQEYGGDLGEPRVEADAGSLARMMRDAGLVSAALGRAGIRHRLEVYSEDNAMLAYLHHEWPREDDPAGRSPV